MSIKPTGHIICTLTISGLVYLFFKSNVAFFVSLIAGVLIDVDHFFDYYLQQRPTLRIEEIYDWCVEKKFEFMFLFFHSLELIFLLWIIISVFRLGISWVALAIGITQHMVLDIFFNQSFLRSYSYILSYRVIRGFKKAYLLR